MISSTTSRKGVSTNGNPTNNGKKKGNKNSNKGVVVKLSTDPQSVAARERRHRISDRFKMLQSLVPGGAKLDTVSMLEQTIQYVKFLKTQVWLHQAILNNNNNNTNHNNTYNNNDDNSNISANNSNSTMNYDDQYDLNDSSSYYNNDNTTYYNDQCFYAMMYGNCNYNYTNQEEGGGGRGGDAFRPEVSLMEMATQATPRHTAEGFSGCHGNDADQVMYCNKRFINY